MQQANPICDKVFDKQFKSIPSEVTRVSTALGLWLNGIYPTSACHADTQLVVAEALNNVVEHAYKNDPHGDIRLQVYFEAGCIHVEILDQGEKFSDILSKKPFTAPAQSLEHLPEGGFGLLLINSLVSEIRHRYESGSNILTLILNLN